MNDDDENIKHLEIRKDIQVIKYSPKDSLVTEIKKTLQVPGDYNIYNALASFSVGRLLNIPQQIILNSLKQYHGCWRRFDQRQGVLNNQELILIYDYAHHPTALRVFLESLREKFPQKNILAVFQPHQYDRTFKLQEQFIQVFKNSSAWVDQLIITDIYNVAGREYGSEGEINALKLVEKTQNSSVVFQPLENLLSYLKNNPSDVIRSEEHTSELQSH